MPLNDDLEEIEAALRQRGTSVSRLCREAAIARSTWDRWKRGETAPNTKTWETVRSAFSRIVDDAAGGAAA